MDGAWLIVLVVVSGLLGSALGAAAAMERAQQPAAEPAARPSARTAWSALVGVLIGAWVGRAAFKWILDVEGTLLLVLVVACAGVGGTLFALAEREERQKAA
jgi:hypothetical protein